MERVRPLVAPALWPMMRPVVRAAAETFADESDTVAFLTRPHPELDGMTPLQVSGLPGGGARVQRLLHSLTHGLPV